LDDASHENPYASPRETRSAKSLQEPISEATKVSRGRLIFLLLAAAGCLMEIALALLSGSAPIPRWLVMGAMIFAVWHGYQWAVTVTAVFLLIAAILFAFGGIRSGSPGAAAIGLALASIMGAVGVMLFKSASLNAFFDYQRRIAREAAEDR